MNNLIIGFCIFGALLCFARCLWLLSQPRDFDPGCYRKPRGFHKERLAIVGLVGFALTGMAQTNEISITTNLTVVIRTNRYAGDAALRVVRGKVYNPAKSDQWKPLVFEIDGVLDAENICLAEKMTERGDYGRWVPDRPIALTNYVATNATIGKLLKVRALRAGIYKSGPTQFELWDAGQPYTYTVITTNKVKTITTNAP